MRCIRIQCNFDVSEVCKDKFFTYVSQQLRMSDVQKGSVSVGISNLWFMKPTAPMTYIRKEFQELIYIVHDLPKLLKEKQVI
jgi:hypothetical protein